MRKLTELEQGSARADEIIYFQTGSVDAVISVHEDALSKQQGQPGGEAKRAVGLHRMRLQKLTQARDDGFGQNGTGHTFPSKRSKQAT